jgi:ribosomal protein L35AE/L33A
MTLRITNFRGGLHTRRERFAVLTGAKDGKEADAFVGARVRGTLPNGNTVRGRVVRRFGTGASLLAHFDGGLSGDALGTPVEPVKKA